MACSTPKAAPPPPAAQQAPAPAVPGEDVDGPPTTLAKPGPGAVLGAIPGAEEYPTAESLPAQPEEGWSVLLAGDAAPIVGVVLDRDGKPWQDVPVVLGPECGEAMLAVTNAEGKFEARGFPRCSLTVSASVERSVDKQTVWPGDKKLELELRPRCDDPADSCPERAAR